MTDKTICFFNSTKAWGGGEKWHFETASALYEKGYKVVFFTNPESELFKKLSETKIPTIPVKINNLSFLNPAKILFLKKKFIENNIGIIIMNLSADLKVAGIASKLAGIKRIVYRRGSAIPIKNTFLNRFIFKNILTEIIANTQATKKTILQNNPNLFPENKIKVIYNGINIKDFEPNINEENSVTENTVIIGNIGRLVEQKAQYLLLELAQILKEKQVLFKIIIGGSGPLENELKEQTKISGLNEFIEFTGFVENPKEFLNKTDIFVLTSKWEGFGYVLAEAGACRKPVIAFNISSNPEIIIDNETGFLVPFGDMKAVAEKILLLSKNKEFSTKMGENASENVMNKFSSKNTISEVENFIKN